MEDWAGVILAALSGLIPSWGDDPPPVYNGYVEADYIYAAPADSGRLVEIAVAEGAEIAEGDTLFRLEDLDQTAALKAAEARVAEAEANLDDLLTGSRDAEIDVLRASIDRAKAELELARKTLDRSTTLIQRELVPAAQVDEDRARVQELEAQLSEFQAQLHVAELPARDAQVAAARAALRAAEAEAGRARSALDDRLVTAPTQGRVERVFFDEGEVASAGTPVVSILPPGARTAIFFVPEPDRTAFALGDNLALACDGCPPGLTAKVTRIASDPQYTPPLIYSRDERQRLVFRAEAEVTGALLPGQPIVLSRP
jgi:HlyD family secretion protein